MDNWENQYLLAQQRQYEQDAQVAKLLQIEFDAKEPEKKPVSSPTKGSLVDPSWELIDPTPNVFNLFISFNRKFFWSKLDAVSLNWSKRMTVCAGICMYEGRGGMCTIALSEPLLKLRPRKDLVETLLHEMIHAYLFVTHNNRDRDGHGPEFHKHMYRINKEAGTNITVYHDFHDEVRLYQQHWWRCNGPCQNRKPFYGIVRRAMNRAPGPNDRWWAAHLATCGGTFVKIKEPEKKENKKTNKVEKPAPKSQGDITKFLVKKTPSATAVKNDGKIVKPNIVGFKDLDHKTMTGVKSNSSSTVLVKTNSKAATPVEPKPVQKIEVFTGTGHSLGTNKSTGTSGYETVRNHWITKFNKTNTKKRHISLPNATSSIPEKKSKLNAGVVSPTSSEIIHCPICYKQCLYDIINWHIDECAKVHDDVFIADEVKTKEEDHKPVSCLVCDKKISSDGLNAHLDDCMSNVFTDDNDFDLAEYSSKSKSESDVVEVVVDCPICNTGIVESKINEHIDNCLTV